METREQRHLELVTENGTKRVLTFELGRDTGVWCLTGEGTLGPAGPRTEGAKLFLRFDGARLYVGTDWSEVQAPGTMTAGGVRLTYGHGPGPRDAPEEDDSTEVRPPPASPSTYPAAGNSSAEFGDDATRIRPPPIGLGLAIPTPSEGSPIAEPDDATRIRPPPRIPFPVPGSASSGAAPAVTVIAGAGGAAFPPPAAGPMPMPAAFPNAHGSEGAAVAPKDKPGFRDDETRIGPPPDVKLRKMTPPVQLAPQSPVQLPPSSQFPPAKPASPASPEATAKSKVAKKITPLQGGILGLMVVVVGMFAVSSMRKGPVPAQPAPPASAAPRASASAVSGARTGAVGSAAARPFGGASAFGVAAPTASAAVTAPPAAAALSAPSPGAGATTGQASALAPAGAGDERAAVLAVESGATDRAAKLYEGLANAHPDKPAYREAARILRAKATP